jgi:sulfite oxidase
MNYDDEPQRSDMLIVQGTEPFNAEPPAAALVEFDYTPEDLLYKRNHGPVCEYPEESYFLTVKCGDTAVLRISAPELRSLFPKAQVVAALQVKRLQNNAPPLTCRSARETGVRKWVQSSQSAA